MKTKIFLLFTFLVLAVSCSKNNPLDSSAITIANYEGTYTGKANYRVIPDGSPKEEDVILIVNKDSTVTFKTKSKYFIFNSV